jgi:tetraacyldisaccharide 4'-kinase
MSSSLKLLFAFGRPFSPLYSLLMTARQHCYRTNLLTVHRLEVPVISVGNLTMGGTGKTPAVAYIAEYLLSLGYRPAIVSRGYGGTAAAAVNVVSDGRGVRMDAGTAGDEPYMLACRLENIPVLTGRTRLHPCRHAIDQFGCTAIVLDDGFQHLAIARDIDLVLFNATTLAGNSRVFPGGELREPVAALHRCSAFLLTGITEQNSERAHRFGELLQKKFPGKLLFHSSLEASLPEPLRPDIATGGNQLPVFAFCAIAHPERFFSTLSALDIQPRGRQTFRDHHRYSQRDIDQLCQDARKTGAGALITTEKDRVKLESLQASLPLLTLKTSFAADAAFPEYLRSAMQRLSSPAL